MTKEEFAKMIDGREYPLELTREEARTAKASELLIIYGASDDLLEVEGVVRDEAGVSDGGDVLFSKSGSIVERPDEDELETLKKFGFDPSTIGGPGVFKVKVIWDGGNGYSWVSETSIPHATFDVLDDGEKYCRGIVIDLAEVRRA